MATTNDRFLRYYLRNTLLLTEEGSEFWHTLRNNSHFKADDIFAALLSILEEEILKTVAADKRLKDYSHQLAFANYLIYQLRSHMKLVFEWVKKTTDFYDEEWKGSFRKYLSNALSYYGGLWQGWDNVSLQNGYVTHRSYRARKIIELPKLSQEEQLRRERCELCYYVRSGDLLLLEQMLASIKNHQKLLELYTLEGVNIFYEAAWRGNVAVFQMLYEKYRRFSPAGSENALEQDKKIFYPDNKANPLHWAVQQGHFELVEFLLEEFVKEEKSILIDTTNQKGQNALQLMLQGIIRNKDKAIDKKNVAKFHKLLIDKGINVTAVDNSGNTILHSAAQIGMAWPSSQPEANKIKPANIQPNLVSVTLQQISPEDRSKLLAQPDQNGYLPIHVAAKEGQFENCQTFIAEHINPYEKSQAVTSWWQNFKSSFNRHAGNNPPTNAGKPWLSPLQKISFFTQNVKTAFTETWGKHPIFPPQPKNTFELLEEKRQKQYFRGDIVIASSQAFCPSEAISGSMQETLVVQGKVSEVLLGGFSFLMNIIFTGLFTNKRRMAAKLDGTAIQAELIRLQIAYLQTAKTEQEQQAALQCLQQNSAAPRYNYNYPTDYQPPDFKNDPQAVEEFIKQYVPTAKKAEASCAVVASALCSLSAIIDKSVSGGSWHLLWKIPTFAVLSLLGSAFYLAVIPIALGFTIYAAKKGYEGMLRQIAQNLIENQQVKKQFNDLYDQYGQGNPNSYANLLPGLNKFPFWEKNLGLPQPGFELPRGNSNQVLG